MKTVAVIPAGGAGTRLWPRSRRSTPKHTLPLGSGGRALLRDKYDRIRGLADDIYVVTELGQRQIQCFKDQNLLRRIREMIVSTNHVGYLHQRIVNDDGALFDAADTKDRNLRLIDQRHTV